MHLVFSLALVGCNVMRSGESPASMSQIETVVDDSNTQASDVSFSDLSLKVESNKLKHIFHSKDGTDCGVFHNDFGSTYCRYTQYKNFTVYFRGVTQSTFNEVIVDYGDTFANEQSATNFGSYSAQILSGNQVVKKYNLPQHWWNSRWRHKFASLKVRANINSLIAKKLVPALKQNQIEPKVYSEAYEAYLPMASAGITKYMPTTGERADIGLMTEHQSKCVVDLLSQKALTESIACQITFAQAEAAASIPWWLKGRDSLSPLNTEAEPTVSLHGNDRYRNGVHYIQQPDSDWSVDTAHQPALCYLPYLLTGDVFYLECLQMQNAYNLANGKYNRDQSGGLNVFDYAQERSVAWSLRSLFQVTKMTPKNVPIYLLPKSYWEKTLKDNLQYIDSNFIKSLNREHQVYRAFVYDPFYGNEYPYVSIWMGAMLTAALGWGVEMGFESWRSVFEFKLEQMLNIATTRQGWDPAIFPYRLYVSEQFGGEVFASWSRASEFYQSVNGSFDDKERYLEIQRGQGLHYHSYLRASLVYAKHLGYPVGTALRDYEAIMLDLSEQGLGGFSWKWALTD